MAYYPMGITNDVNKMIERKKELLEIQQYLKKNPNEKTHKGMTLEDVENLLHSIDSFEFLP